MVGSVAGGTLMLDLSNVHVGSCGCISPFTRRMIEMGAVAGFTCAHGHGIRLFTAGATTARLYRTVTHESVHVLLTEMGQHGAHIIDHISRRSLAWGRI